MSDTVLRARQLGELLRSRRERLQPSDVGLPNGKRRRTPGLRREEVAQLAAISPTYYAFLEQGRPMRPSAQVLDALCAALRMDGTERAHVRALVHDTRPTAEPRTGESVPPPVVTLVDRLDPSPAYVTGRCWDVLAANRAARALWTDWPALPPRDRNMLWWVFTDPAARQVLVDWEETASELLGRFRAAADRHPGDTTFNHLIERLHTHSPEFRAWWPLHHIAPLRSGAKRIRHPALGEMLFDHVVLQLADNPEQRLLTFHTTDENLAGIARVCGQR